jgi:hypothetical protein
MGGDGNGIGGFVGGKPLVSKAINTTADKFVSDVEWDNKRYIFHTRRASVGSINDDNCHPFIWGNTITMHNGHIDGAGVLKLMMLENFNRYEPDGWTLEKLINSTDSNIMAYFIWKRGFEIVSLLSCGTVVTMYPHQTLLHAGNNLEAIEINGVWIFASEFPDTMGMTSQQWLIFEKGTEIVVKTTGECIITKGHCFDGKKAYLLKKESERKNKKNKRKPESVEVE